MLSSSGGIIDLRCRTYAYNDDGTTSMLRCFWGGSKVKMRFTYETTSTTASDKVIIKNSPTLVAESEYLKKDLDKERSYFISPSDSAQAAFNF
jgi:hypothetical protein